MVKSIDINGCSLADLVSRSNDIMHAICTPGAVSGQLGENCMLHVKMALSCYRYLIRKSCAARREGALMAIGNVLDPTSSFSNDIAGSGPDVGDLAGRKIGFRVDMLWRSWDWVSEIWAESLRAEGAEVSFWRSLGRTAEEGGRMKAEMNAFFDGVDTQ